MAGLGLDEVIFVPAAKNPLKGKRPTASGPQRLEMLRLTLQDAQGMGVSDIELSRNGPSYAVETVAEMLMVRPGAYWFLVGADALAELPRWKDPDRLLRLCRIGVAERPGASVGSSLARVDPELHDRIDVFEMPPAPVSSSMIRERIVVGGVWEPYVHPAVADYIREGALYQEPTVADR
jgi:nicotinate-nucleotide adenylyltransferase